MNRIDTIRAKKHLSYGDIAKETGLTPTYIQFLAKGKRTNPSLDAMRKIASALGETIDAVFRINKAI